MNQEEDYNLAYLAIRNYATLTGVVDQAVMKKAATIAAEQNTVLREWEKLTNSKPFWLYSGRYFYPLRPKAEDIFIEDIAHALSNISRYNGHLSKFYSVAQHSIMVSRIVPEQFAFQGLMHDAPEAFGINDMIHPVKVCLREYKGIELGIWMAVAKRFGLPVELDPSIKKADNIMVKTEKRDLRNIQSPDDEYPDVNALEDVTIEPMAPGEAKEKFLARFKELWKHEPF